MMCDVPTSFLTRPIPPSQGGGTAGKEVRARRSSGGFISRGPPSQATLHPSQASAAGKRLQLLLWNFQPNLGGLLLLVGLTPGPATVVYYALFNLPRKLTFGSRLDIKALDRDDKEGWQRVLLAALQTCLRRKGTILQGGARARRGGVQNLLAGR